MNREEYINNARLIARRGSECPSAKRRTSGTLGMQFHSAETA